ncbi:hypothetical protein [Reichenbachiella sp. MALMAid0571]|uniref:hypothetical protein n=1 Tax=Reichenbachiella sp. MALMAid0571 TaxID=3143939 RepID=UPI0032DF5B02
MKTINHGLILIMVCFSACYTKSDMTAVVEEIGGDFRMMKNVNEYTFDLQLQPANYLIEKRIGTKNNSLPIDSIKMEYEGLLRFTLNLSRTDQTDLINDQKDVVEQQKSIYYFSYRFNKDIYLETAQDKIPVALYHFERSYDLKNNRSFVFAFDSEAIVGDKVRLVIDSDELNTGPVKFRFDLNELNKI